MVKRKRMSSSKRRMKRRIVRVPKSMPARSMTGVKINVKRMFYSGTWVWGTATTGDFWKAFEPTVANGFNNFSEFAAVFDRYKVNAIKVTFRPRFDTVAAPVTGATPLTVVKPYMCIVKDPFTTLVPSGLYTSANLNTLLENGGRVYDADRTVSVYYRPYISVPTNTGSGQWYKRAPYLRTNDVTTPMRGFQAFAYQNNFSNIATDLVWDVFVTMYVTFKDLK